MLAKNKQPQPKITLIDALKSALLSQALSTQDDIKHALKLQGFDVNQSKISRLLRKVGAIKITNESNQIIYSLPRDPSPISTKNVLSQLILNIAANESLIVIYTNPGSASLIARLLDHNNQILNLLGTVAGDDTIFVAPKSVKQLDLVLKNVKEFLGWVG